jgi:hypothetical protein
MNIFDTIFYAEIFGWVAIYLTIAVTAGIVAYRKDRGEVAWGFLTFLFPPLILILLALPKLQVRA